LQRDDPRFAITFIDTKADVTVRPNVIVSTFRHADVTDIEGNGSSPYGDVKIRYFNVVDQACYDAPGDNSRLCRCSTSNEVTTSNGAVIPPIFSTALRVTGADTIVQTIVRDELAPLLDSDATIIVADQAYVAYCLRLSLVTKDDPIPLDANAQGVLTNVTLT
jgi:hypothetical protein